MAVAFGSLKPQLTPKNVMLKLASDETRIFDEVRDVALKFAKSDGSKVKKRERVWRWLGSD